MRLGYACISITALILLYNLYITGNLYRQISYWGSKLDQIKTHVALMNSDTNWIKWQRPEQVEQYVLMWLFQHSNYGEVKIKSELELQNNIKVINIEVLVNKDSIFRLTEKLKNPPFGKVEIIRSITSTTNQDLVELKWYFSSALPANTKISPIQNQVTLNLNSIIIYESSWTIRLNNKWISSEDPEIDNIKIAKVMPDLVTIEILTTKGLKIVELKCGSNIVISYT